MKHFVAVLGVWLLLGTQTSFSQSKTAQSFSELYQAVQTLPETGRVLYIAAHPDDENTRLLAYLAKERKYATAYLSLTRGDGGQNLIGNEQGVGLGFIRTQELLAARRLDGAVQYFTRAFDFGFSKTTEEAIRFWGEKNVLADVVWVIRKFQPDVIITRFPPDARAGHGHHSASAVLAKQAFDAAADKTMFAEQFDLGVQPWQAKRLLWNTFNFGSTNTTSENQLQLNVSNYNWVLGKSYGELAAESRSEHKSQGFGVPAQRGTLKEYFLPVAGDSATTDIMDGVPSKWAAWQAVDVAATLHQIAQNFSVNNYAETFTKLVAVRNQLTKLPKTVGLTEKLEKIDELLAHLAGIYADAFVTQPKYILGDSLAINIQALQRISGAAVQLQAVEIAAGNKTELLPNAMLTTQVLWQQTTKIAANTGMLTQPYWLRLPKQLGYFSVENPADIGQPWNQPPVTVQFKFMVGSHALSVKVPVQYKYTDPIRGELYEPIAITAPVQAEFTLVNIVATGTQAQPIQLRFKGKVSSGHEVAVNDYVVYKAAAAKTLDTIFTITSKQLNLSNKPQILTATFNKQKLFTEQAIRHTHIPPIYYHVPTTANYLPLDVKKQGTTVGYIAGAGDDVAAALEAIGYTVVPLNAQNITLENIQHLQAIVTGVRAYNIHSFLQDKYAILMQYVQQGGNLIVQYNTNSQIGPVKANIAPYPLQIGRTRVTEENAAVSFAVPEHAVLTLPNKITQADFTGWVQERSVYQAENLEKNYVAPIVMNDSNEKPSNGSLVIAPYGKGNFVYNALALFRQLPAGVPGAYRLLANIVSLPPNP
ncbi:MAG: PIG-L family deacetylase [Bacteroidetes bacterium]|nr:MAG: PIG-L family deacetylase [Bacteroidota bacterium]